MDENLIDGKEVNVKYEDFHALHDILISVKAGELVGIIGPNGCGKSTLLRSINGLLKIESGDLTVNGLDVRKVSLEEMAKMCSNIPTEFPPDFNLSVYEVVMLGRYPHRKSMWWETPEDEEVVKTALEMFGIDHLWKRDITQLSSGERQRTLIAKAYVQQPRVMLVDEPTAHLDIRYTLEVMQYFKDLIRNEKDMAIVIAAHDLNTVAKYCDRIVMMKKGRIAAYGTPEEVVTEKNIREVYGVEADVIKHNGATVMIAKHPIPNNDNVEVPAVSVCETEVIDNPDAL
jgi:ABC-type cobalamin/Fe3+-siderophores transport systems, ATPase components